MKIVPSPSFVIQESFQKDDQLSFLQYNCFLSWFVVLMQWTLLWNTFATIKLGDYLLPKIQKLHLLSKRSTYQEVSEFG